ncbi:MAG: M3 family metallopeptidase [Bacteroidota bacterium]
MKRNILVLATVVSSLMSCSEDGTEKKEKMAVTPFDGIYETPFQTPTFNTITIDSYMPAFKEGMKEQNEEIAAIVNNSEAATFENTIAALDYSGKKLDKVSSVFYNLTSAETNEEMNKLAAELSPMLSKHSDDISLNEDLFKRVKSVYENKDELNLNSDQQRLLEKTYNDFVRNGANLQGEAKERMREINKELSGLTLKFGENILAETNKFKLFIEDKNDLSGLPESVIQGAAGAAKAEGKEGQWLFTIHKPSLIPFLMYADNRDLREKMFKAYITKGDHGDELDNKDNLTKIANLRIEKANLLGFDTWANYVLDINMAKTPENVNKLLDELMTAALPKAKYEASELQKIIDKEGGKFELEAWDWWYYAEKLKKEKYAFDEEELRPYFKLENVRDGAFAVANKLYGITFEQRNDIQTYHKDVTVWEVKEADGTHIGIFYLDYFPRAGKRGGAWMNSYRKQSVDAEGKLITPIITNVCNFTKPTADKPSLLSVDEVETLFHEFGHGLHGLLSKGVYPSLTGTAVARDFVELPSQIMENWALDSEVLKMYAKHYETGEVIPDELITKLENAGKFNQGFATVEYLSAALLDMDWHTLKDANTKTANEFEDASMAKMNMVSEIVVRYRSTYFNHIFSGGYSSGYYAYVWAEILDADAFEAFKENGIFDKETAAKFRTNILEKGGSEDGMELYKKFRGQDPSTEALKKRKGL